MKEPGSRAGLKVVIGPLLCVLLIALWTFVANAQGHANPSPRDLIAYALIGLAYGAGVMGLVLVVFLPLAWLSRRRGPPTPPSAP